MKFKRYHRSQRSPCPSHRASERPCTAHSPGRRTARGPDRTELERGRDPPPVSLRPCIPPAAPGEPHALLPGLAQPASFATGPSPSLLLPGLYTHSAAHSTPGCRCRGWWPSHGRAATARRLEPTCAAGQGPQPQTEPPALLPRTGPGKASPDVPEPGPQCPAGSSPRRRSAYKDQVPAASPKVSPLTQKQAG